MRILRAWDLEVVWTVPASSILKLDSNITTLQGQILSNKIRTIRSLGTNILEFFLGWWGVGGIPKIFVYARQFVSVACFGLTVAYVGQYAACHQICAIRFFCRMHDSNTFVDVARGTAYVHTASLWRDTYEKKNLFRPLRRNSEGRDEHGILKIHS